MRDAGFVIGSESTAAAGLADLLTGLRYWRVWHLLGISDLRHHYARSRLGQLWLTRRS
jgi:ABC-type polysaccharide/polyol phosphate export permease